MDRFKNTYKVLFVDLGRPLMQSRLIKGKDELFLDKNRPKTYIMIPD